MVRSKRNVVKLVQPQEARDALAGKLDEVAENLADALMQSAEIHEKIDGLKALSAYYQATRGKSASAAPAPKNAFEAYRSAQESE